MGVYEPIVTTFFEACVASVNLPLDPAEVDEATFMPSARSVAFRREAIEAVGGYPEWLPIGEDMWVDLRWRERGVAMRLAPDAVARWRPRASLAATWTQYFRYARGDARAGMHPERHARPLRRVRGAWQRRRFHGAAGRRRSPRAAPSPTASAGRTRVGARADAGRARRSDGRRAGAHGVDRRGEDGRVRRGARGPVLRTADRDRQPYS